MIMDELFNFDRDGISYTYTSVGPSIETKEPCYKEDLEKAKEEIEEDIKKIKKNHSYYDDEMLHFLLKEIEEKKAKETDEKLKALEKKSRRDFIKFITNSIREVKFHDPHTIIFWKNGDVTRIKCQDGDIYDKEKGFAIALLKYLLGENTSDFNTIFKKWVPEDSE